MSEGVLVKMQVLSASGIWVPYTGQGGLSSWTVNHHPNAATQATITQAAPGSGRTNVVTSFVATFVAGASAPTAGSVSFAIIDGVSGGTTYLLGPIELGIPAVAGATNGIVISGLSIAGTANTATTIEFSTGYASTKESVSMQGLVTA